LQLVLIANIKLTSEHDGKTHLCSSQGRLLHINDGANAPWKK